MLLGNNTTVNTQAIVIAIFKTIALIYPVATVFLIADTQDYAVAGLRWPRRGTPRHDI
jgi:hypothetical protein